MKQRVPVVLVVSFPDEILQKDVDEALVQALDNLRKVFGLAPAFAGRSTTGKKVAFRIEDIEPLIEVESSPPPPSLAPPPAHIARAPAIDEPEG